MSRIRTICRLLILLLLCWSSASAQTAFSTRYTNTATNGDIVLIGNVNYYCTTDRNYATRQEADACTSAMTGGSVTNNSVYMRPIDTDSNSATSNSSSATLNLPSGSTVLFAGLYWSGISSSANNRARAYLAGPSGAGTAITASSTSTIGDNYQSFLDVTSTVQAGGSGVYTVGNIASSAGNGSWAGWSLVVAFKNSALPTKNLAIFDGFQQASSASNPVDIAVSGFLTPRIGTVNSTIGVIAYDGDRGQNEGASATPPGSLKFGAATTSLANVSNTANPVNDVFNSTISVLGSDVTAGRNPTYTNTLGLDIDTFTPNTALGNGSTSAVVRVIGTSGDVIFPGVITLATEIFVPNIKDSLTKTVTDLNGGATVPGDTLEYELVIKNLGNDGATDMVLTDSLPANTTYLPGSLVITGINAGTKTDAAADDQAEYSAATNKVTFRLGSGANATSGGTLLPNEETRVRFRVKVNAGVTGGTVISNSGAVTYKQQTLGTVVTDTSDSDPSTAGDQPAVITVSGPDLKLTKTHTGTFMTGQEGTFTLTVTNAGVAPSIGTITVTDTLPTGLTATAISGTGWACTLATLTCTRSDVLAAGSSYPNITLTVKPTQAGSVTNNASVSGGGEAAALGNNNAASDTITVTAPVPPNVTLTKTVRNVTRSGAEGITSVGYPGDTLEYCVTYTNSGGNAQFFALQDKLVSTVTALPDAYSTGYGLRLTADGVTTDLTSVIDSDAGSLVGDTMRLSLSMLQGGSSGKVCFRAKIN